MAVVIMNRKRDHQEDLNKSLLAIIEAIHNVLDTVFAGIVEAGRPHNKSILIAGNPVEAIHPYVQQILKVLDAHAGAKVDATLLYSPLLRVLSVQDSNPLREANAVNLKSELPFLHQFAWKIMSEMEKRVCCPPITKLLDLFLTRNHSEQNIIGIFEFLSATESGRMESAAHGKALVRCAIDSLALSKAKDQNKMPLTKKLRVHKSKLAEEDPPITGSDAQLRRNACLKWIIVAFSQASFNYSISPALKSELFHILLSSVSSLEKLLVLQAMASLVLFEQPATLSPLLPILMNFVARALAYDETRSTAQKIARQIDILIRPRRAFAPRKLPSVPESSVNDDRSAAMNCASRNNTNHIESAYITPTATLSEKDGALQDVQGIDATFRQRDGATVLSSFKAEFSNTSFQGTFEAAKSPTQ